MNSFAVIAFFAAVAAANASGILAPSANILQGPSSRTTLVGPEGSVISSVAPGGQVITENLPGVVAHTAPVLSAYSAPVLSAYSAPVVSAYSAYGVPAISAYHGYSAPIVSAHSAYAVPSVYAAPVHGSVDTVVSGPSGTIASSRGLTASDVVGHYGHYGY